MASNKCSQEQTWPIGGKKELNYIYCQQLATLLLYSLKQNEIIMAIDTSLGCFIITLDIVDLQHKDLHRVDHQPGR